MKKNKCPKCKKENFIEGGEIDPKDLKEWPYYICQSCYHVWHGKKREIK